MNLEYNEVQVFKTSKRLMLMGVPNNVDRDGLQALL